MADSPKVWHKTDPLAPKDAVYVGRPTQWGNPFLIDRFNTREGVIEKYRDWLDDQIALGRLDPQELHGRPLTCWCSPNPCHADRLLELANPHASP